MREIARELAGREDPMPRLNRLEPARSNDTKLEELAIAYAFSDTTGVIIVIMDPQGDVVYTNKAFTNATGYALPEMAGKRRSILLSTPDEEEEVARAHAALRAGKLPCEMVESWTTKDGQLRTITTANTVIFHPDGSTRYLICLAVDVTERREAEARLSESYHRVERALNQSVKALSSMTDIRDPYTAGHQQRVAKLAGAIAAEMGMYTDRVEILRIAGLLHDIGKISIPVDILSKPTRLSPLEMGLIEYHCEMGYRILSQIDFPGPVARIVLEHHERLDGSGYPRGRRGAETILEARILAVADVLEAMSSHRPYRPAWPMEDALGEIREHRDTLYDSGAVDACVSIFNHGYEFS